MYLRPFRSTCKVWMKLVTGTNSWIILTESLVTLSVFLCETKVVTLGHKYVIAGIMIPYFVQVGGDVVRFVFLFPSAMSKGLVM